MNFRSFALVTLTLLVRLSLADEAPRIVDPIADGAPSEPAPELPKLDISPEDVIETKVRDLGERKITIQKVNPVELPPMPQPAPPVELTPQQIEELRSMRQDEKESILLMMSVTVYRSEHFDEGVRTQFRWWSRERGEDFEAWSNVNGNWLTGFANFETSNRIYAMLLGIGNYDIDGWKAALKSRGRDFNEPEIPDIPSGGPAFVVTKGAPTLEELAPIQAIHDLVEADGEAMRRAFEARERARIEQEVFLKANPPKPKDIVLRYWKIEKSSVAKEGGDQ